MVVPHIFDLCIFSFLGLTSFFILYDGFTRQARVLFLWSVAVDGEVNFGLFQNFMRIQTAERICTPIQAPATRTIMSCCCPNVFFCFFPTPFFRILPFLVFVALPFLPFLSLLSAKVVVMLCSFLFLFLSCSFILASFFVFLFVSILVWNRWPRLLLQIQYSRGKAVLFFVTLPRTKYFIPRGENYIFGKLKRPYGRSEGAC